MTLSGSRKPELCQDVVPDTLRGAGRECRYRMVGKLFADAVEQAIFGPELVTPFRDAMRFVDGEETDGNARQPAERVGPRQTFGRKVQQAKGALGSLLHARATVRRR